MTPARAEGWEGFTAAELAERWGMPEVHLFRSVGSTNDEARRLAAGGAPSGTAVLAEEQVAGRGRSGGSWASPPGLGVWLSVIVRPSALPAPGLLPLRVGLGAARALERWAPAGAVRIKWPNDLLVGDRKLGGILCEASWEGEMPGAVVIGIGVNVLHDPNDFPEDLRERATSLRLASRGVEIRRAEVAGALARATLDAGSTVPETLVGRAMREMRQRDALAERWVRITGGGAAAPVEGLALGVAGDGALLVRTSRGVLRTVRSGTVRVVGSGAPR